MMTVLKEEEVLPILIKKITIHRAQKKQILEIQKMQKKIE